MSTNLVTLFERLALGCEINQQSFPHRPIKPDDAFVHDAKYRLVCMMEQVGTLSRCLKGTDKGMEMKREDILTMRASALQLTVASMQMFMLTNHPIEGLAGTDAAQLAQYIDWQFPAPKSDAPKGIQENAL
jgi:hypothetical protein